MNQVRTPLPSSAIPHPPAQPFASGSPVSGPRAPIRDPLEPFRQFRCTLIEAQEKIGAAPINPFNSQNPILVRDLNWIKASAECNDYQGRVFREIVNSILEIQRKGKPFFYGVTHGRLQKYLEYYEKNPDEFRVMRWHDGNNGRTFSNEHVIDLKAIFMLLRTQAADNVINLETIYECLRQLIFYVSAAEAEKLRPIQMVSTKKEMKNGGNWNVLNWDCNELFIKLRKNEMTDLYLIPGNLEKVGNNWPIP